MKFYEAYMNNGGTFETSPSSPTIDGLITKISTYYQDGEFPGIESIACFENDDYTYISQSEKDVIEFRIERLIEAEKTNSQYQAEHEQSLRGAQ